MIQLDAATVLLQWATGGLLFLWVTTRRREVGIGYGWLLRGVYGAMAMGAVAAGIGLGSSTGRDACSALTAAATIAALTVSVVRRKAGVAGERAREERVAARIHGSGDDSRPIRPSSVTRTEFPPALDLVAPVIGAVGLVFAGIHAGGNHDVLSVARTLAGAVFLGAVSDAMLLGHWYLVQPGLGRAPLLELVKWTSWVWPLEVGLLLLPPGMIDAITGHIDDGWDGTLTWFWVACAVTTIALCFVTRAALKERAYSAVMAATGLLYLAILTAFGTDLVARAILAG
ncbi:MAG: hypothetical protein JOZ68_15065 [Acidimicrobiia bacterium]|nr:hypothetical protein [Acidimicrobiia bacterium]MBV9042324.1 hypothetical protein [Acidimicrobiia bacterium]